MSRKRIIEKENFFLVEERKGSGPLIIQSSGYTSDERAIKEPWILTQFRTIPHSDRSHLPDPVIFKHNNLLPYRYLDCNVWTLYFRPECQGLENALEEFSRYYETLTEKPILLGYSKGGLFFGSLTECLEDLKIALIAPTVKTITGDEEEMLRRLNNKAQNARIKEKLIIALVKKVVKIIGSRRPIDKDMSMGSEFIKKHTFKNLANNHSLLIIGRGSQESWIDKMCYKFGQLLELPKDSDGMTEIPEIQAQDMVVVSATHMTIMEDPAADLKLFKFVWDFTK